MYIGNLNTGMYIIEPEIKRAKGRHTRRVYSTRNLLQAAVIKELVSWHIDLQKIKEITANLDPRGDGYVRVSESKNSYITIKANKINDSLFAKIVTENKKKS